VGAEFLALPPSGRTGAQHKQPGNSKFLCAVDTIAFRVTGMVAVTLRCTHAPPL